MYNRLMRKLSRNRTVDLSKKKIYSDLGFWVKLWLFTKYFVQDRIYYARQGRKEFKEYGITIFCGEQGAGKSVAMVEYLERMRLKYPSVKIITNFGYKHEDESFNDWQQFFDVRNGLDGVIFAIDEIQNEFNSQKFKEFPEALLGEITQQRKQRVKIVTTAQYFEDVVVQMRRQTHFVVQCMTVAERLVWTRCYKKRDYEKAINRVEGFKNVRKMYSRVFVQDAAIRELFDTDKKIERLSRTVFLPRSERA